MKKPTLLILTFIVLLLGTIWIFSVKPSHPAPQKPDAPERMVKSSTKTILQGRVIDPRGRPLEKVAIHIDSSDLESVSHRAYFSGPNGYFQVPLGSSNQGSLLFRAEGFQDARLAYLGATENLVVTMTPTSTNQKQVLWIVNQTGEKIHGAQVFRYPGETLTSVAGKVWIDHFSELKTLNIYAPGYLRRTFNEFNHFQNPHTIRLTPTWTLRIRVTDRISGDPIKLFRLQFEQQGKETFLEVETKDGNFSLAELHPQKNLIELTAPGFHAYFLDRSQNVAMKTEPAEFHHFELGQSIYTGTVVSSEGIPLQDAFVHFLHVPLVSPGLNNKRSRRGHREAFLGAIDTTAPYRIPGSHFPASWSSGSSTWSDMDFVSTDAAGAFTFQFPEENLALDMLVYAPGYHPFFIHRADKLLSKNHGHFPIELKPFAKISGSAGQANSHLQRRVVLQDANQAVWEVLLEQGVTQFEFDNVPAGWASLKMVGAKHQKNPPSATSIETDLAEPGIVPEQKWLKIKAGETYFEKIGFKRAYLLQGQVFWDNQPLVEKWLKIYLVSDPRKHVNVQTDAHGSFRLAHLPKAIYGIRMAQHDTEKGNLLNRFLIDLKRDETKLVLSFFSNSTVFGRILDAPKNAYLELISSQRDPWKDLVNTARSRATLIKSRDPYPNQSTLEITHHQPSGNSARFTLPLDPSGLFKFENIPQGWVSLAVHYNDTSETLVHSAAMPTGNDHLDLGELQLDQKGQLEIVFEGGEPFAEQFIRLRFLGQHANHPFAELPEREVHPIGSVMIEDVPKGRLIVDFQPELNWEACGYQVPQPIFADIEPFKTTQIRIPLIPLANLHFYSSDFPEGNDLVVELRNLETGSFFAIDKEFIDRAFYELSVDYPPKNPFFHLGFNEPQSPEAMAFSAFYLPEGPYQIDFRLQNRLARFSVFLEAGKSRKMPLFASDFIDL